MTGSSFSTCCAASSPSFTSSAGLYLFLGATIAVWATVVTTNAARLAAVRADFTCVRDISLTPPPRLCAARCPGCCGKRATDRRPSWPTFDSAFTGKPQPRYGHIGWDWGSPRYTGPRPGRAVILNYDARMRLTSMLAAAAFLSTLGVGSGPVAPQQAHTVLLFGHLWDGTKMLDDVVVTVDGDKISLIESGRKQPLPGATDFRRYTAIPGLIDLHTHITYYWDRKAGTRPLGQRRRPAATVFLAQDNARRTLETGVTTVRDLGASGESDFAMRDLIALGAMTGPRMFVAGRGIPPGGGVLPPAAAAAVGWAERWQRVPGV